MIKRGRPARSRYRNLEEFIEIARSIHGDLYDYSETVLNGSQDPISFKCNRCGTTRTLSQAGSHIRKIRPCGCKPCNHDRLSPCKNCGVAVSSKVYHSQAKRCKECCDKAKQARVAHKESKHGKNCRVCNTWFVKRDTPFCSKECSKAAVAKPVAFCCAYCGAEGFKDPHKIRSATKRLFCTPDCQRRFQSTRYWDYQSKGQREKGIVSRGKTKIARSKWAKQRRLERMQSSNGAKWWSKCKEQTAKVGRQFEVSDWDRRCNSAAGLLKSRREPTFKLEKYVLHSWEKTIRKNRQKLLIDSRTKEEKEWSMKINTAAKSCKLRFLAKNKNATGCFGTSIEVAAQGSLPFAE